MGDRGPMTGQFPDLFTEKEKRSTHPFPEHPATVATEAPLPMTCFSPLCLLSKVLSSLKDFAGPRKGLWGRRGVTELPTSAGRVEPPLADGEPGAGAEFGDGDRGKGVGAELVPATQKLGDAACGPPATPAWVRPSSGPRSVWGDLGLWGRLTV